MVAGCMVDERNRVMGESSGCFISSEGGREQIAIILDEVEISGSCLSIMDSGVFE